ncbi:hypothetical protein GM661_02955 [Iocasia frigidifontis]|uniref:Accessory gene regulator B n=1 Tax=Iocasia fonsfrigidae TaxID=2682810 RepID=A0A8A7KBR4_9FIRM|nr:accessory gene regulator B family protein [Iocasia fonsfrigidae]QTL97008.1 hypothetical protein GM661_02955 [Iocasia fonsfrigidae]
MVKTISKQIADYFNQKLDLSREETSSIDYGCQVIFYLLIEIISFILVSSFLNMFWPVMIALVVFLILRPYAGGIHMPSYLLCYIFSLLVFISIGCLVNLVSIPAKYLISWLVFVFILSLLLINKYAPADTAIQPIKDPSRRRKLKTISLLIIICWFLISLAIMFSFANYYNLLFAGSLGLLAEALALHPLAFYVIDKYLPDQD